MSAAKKNGLKLFETKVTKLDFGVNIIKAEAADNAQLDLLVAMLEARFSEGWVLLDTTAVGPYIVYTLEKDFREDPEEKWRGQS